MYFDYADIFLTMHIYVSDFWINVSLSKIADTVLVCIR